MASNQCTWEHKEHKAAVAMKDCVNGQCGTWGVR